MLWLTALACLLPATLAAIRPDVLESMETAQREFEEYYSALECDWAPPRYPALEAEMLESCESTACVCGDVRQCDFMTFDLVDEMNKVTDYKAERGAKALLGSSLARTFARLRRHVYRRPHGRTAYANELLEPTITAYHLWQRDQRRAAASSAERSAENALPLNEADLAAFQCFYDSTEGEQWRVCRNGREQPCRCSNIICEVHDNQRRIVGLALADVRLAGELPDCVTDLTLLRVLDLNGADFLPRWPVGIGRLAHLQLLSMPPPAQETPDEVANLTSLKFLSLSNSQHDDHRGSFDTIAPICRLPNLLSLYLQNGWDGALPECIANLTTLLRLDLCSNHMYNTGIPAAWGTGLVNLRSFISFQNGRFECPPSDSDSGIDCTALYQSTVEYAAEAVWMCRNVSLSGPLPDTLRNWKKIEKFWVDANYLSGPIPDWIGTDWSQLRTLDLFNNAFTGSIPESLGQLNQLEQAQLQDNQLTGDIPQSLVRLPRLALLHVALNTQLTGCLPASTPDRIVVRTATHTTLCPSHDDL